MALYSNEDKAKILTNVAKSADMFDVVGELKADSDLKKWATPILSTPRIFNEYINTLTEQFLFVVTRANMFTSAFDTFREKRDTLGRGTYETYVEPILPMEYDMTAFDRVLKFYPTNVKAQYFAINRDHTFGQTIVRKELQRIFDSWENLDRFFEQLITAIPNGNVLIENSYCKELLNTNIASGAIKSLVWNKPTTKDDWYALAEKIQSIALGMCAEPSADYNNYANLENGDGQPVYAQSRRDDLVFIGDKDIISGIKTYVLTTAFQEEHVDFKFDFVVLNDTGYREYNSKTQEFGAYHKGLFNLIICDGGALKLEDNYEDTLEDYNIFTRGLQRAVHIQQTYGIRAFRNMVAFVDPNAVLEGVTANETSLALNADTTTETITMTTIPEDFIASYTAEIKPTNELLIMNADNVYSLTNSDTYVMSMINAPTVNNNTITVSSNNDYSALEPIKELVPDDFAINSDTQVYASYDLIITEQSSGKIVKIPTSINVKPFTTA